MEGRRPYPTVAAPLVDDDDVFLGMRRIAPDLTRVGALPGQDEETAAFAVLTGRRGPGDPTIADGEARQGRGIAQDGLVVQVDPAALPVASRVMVGSTLRIASPNRLCLYTYCFRAM